MKLSFLGAGNLPETIINAIVKKLNFKFKEEDIIIYDKMQSQYDRYDRIGIIKAATLKNAIEYGEIIFLAVKPQNFDGIFDEIKELNLDLSHKIFISLAASITLEYIENKLGQDIAIVRTMSNTPAFVGEAMTAICKNNCISEEAFKEICNIFESFGKIIVLSEDKMNKIISVNGSSPAYVYLFAEAMLQGAEAQGFFRDEVYIAVMQSLYGSLLMLMNSGKQPNELIKSVASPNGTTERALKSLNNDNFINIIKKAMSECTARANEMTSEFCSSYNFYDLKDK